jgi:formylglycine-generating enzyme required for sulfatase activity
VLGEEFWKKHGEKVSEKAALDSDEVKRLDNVNRMKWKDPSVISLLVNQLEAKLLPVEALDVLFSKTEFTVGEWKLYLKAEGLAEWKQPSTDWHQTDEHPIVMVNMLEITTMCEWLSNATGRQWRLPSARERSIARGATKFPWGDYFPPKAGDGNYACLLDGTFDRSKKGVDGFFGTCPVATFKPNQFGLYDMGGNVGEWLEPEQKSDRRARHIGGGWDSLVTEGVNANNGYESRYPGVGFRIVRAR